MSTESDPHSHSEPDDNTNESGWAIEAFDYKSLGWRRYPNPNVPGLSFGLITDGAAVGWVIRRDSCAGRHATELIAYELGDSIDDTRRVAEYPLRYETHDTCEDADEYAISLIRRIENKEIDHPTDADIEPLQSYREFDH